MCYRILNQYNEKLCSAIFKKQIIEPCVAVAMTNLRMVVAWRQIVPCSTHHFHLFMTLRFQNISADRLVNHLDLLATDFSW